MRIKQSKKIDAVRINHEFLLECSINKNISKKAYRILFYLLSVADSRNFVLVSQKDIAYKIGMDKSSVSLAFKNLKEEGIIESYHYGHTVRFVEYEDEEFDFFN